MIQLLTEWRTSYGTASYPTLGPATVGFYREVMVWANLSLAWVGGLSLAEGIKR